MALQILRQRLSRDLDPDTGKRRVVGFEDITAGCRLLPYYDVHNQDKRRVVFNPGKRPVQHQDGSLAGGEENIGVKYIDGPFRDCWDAQPGFVIRGVEMKSDRLVLHTEGEMLSHPPDDASRAEPLESETPSGETLGGGSEMLWRMGLHPSQQESAINNDDTSDATGPDAANE